ncbi:MAG: class I SAM-dependent methyltransferase [bacterium]|nr:class I SAM-dependent methyltransferase [bacterium]
MTSPVYREPRYYDIAFGWDPGPETDFLEACFKRYAPGEVRSVLDVACGSGRFSLELARRGRTVAGIDISRDMIEYLGKKAILEGLPVEVFARDMREFQLPRRDFDAAVCMTDSFTYLVDIPSVIGHLRAVARHLAPRGLYVVDFGTVVDPGRPFGDPESWEMSRDEVRVVFTGNRWEGFDPVRQVATEVLRMEIGERGQGQVFEQKTVKRVLYPQEFLALVEASAVFELAAWFQGFDLERPFDVPPYHRRLIAVLSRKTELPAPPVKTARPPIEGLKRPTEAGVPEEAPRPVEEAGGRRRGRKRDKTRVKPEQPRAAAPAPPRLPPARDDSDAIEEYWARGRDEPWRPPKPEPAAEPPAPAKRRRRRRKKAGGQPEENPVS